MKKSFTFGHISIYVHTVLFLKSGSDNILKVCYLEKYLKGLQRYLHQVMQLWNSCRLCYFYARNLIFFTGISHTLLACSDQPFILLEPKENEKVFCPKTYGKGESLCEL